MTEAGEWHYERIVAELMAAIAAEERVRTLRAERDAVVAGRTEEHAADVYWEFTDGDIVYKTLVRAREWDREVDGRTLFTFVTMIRDITGQAAGVWFTQPVFRQEVLRLAADAGVLLYELGPLAELAPEPVAADVRIEVDAAWARREKERLGRGEEVFQVSGSPRAMFIYDEAGDCVDSVDGVIGDYLKAARGGGAPRRVEHCFAGPAFMRTEDEAFPLVKLSGIYFDVEMVDMAELDGREMVGRILAAVLGHYSPAGRR